MSKLEEIKTDIRFLISKVGRKEAERRLYAAGISLSLVTKLISENYYCEPGERIFLAVNAAIVGGSR